MAQITRIQESDDTSSNLKVSDTSISYDVVIPKGLVAGRLYVCSRSLSALTSIKVSVLDQVTYKLGGTRYVH